MQDLIKTICDNPTVDVFWGNRHYGFKIGSSHLTDAYSTAKKWFEENSHYFHLENFPPHQRMQYNEGCIEIDYGSHIHFVYCLPAVK